ncbi:MAG: hypothetical protein ACSHXA_07480 [Polaribacter sp.]|uniref:hypothetical protein n=1 Tax=Polaribacter sp. TaxID=1920175 RepID=UPI003EF25452
MKFLEQIRLICSMVLSFLIAIVTDTRGFVLALVIAFAFNIWSGMRADGISISKCKNFSFSKFWKAILELLTYVIIIYVIQSIMHSLGDKEAAKVVIKTISYVFVYVYCQNGLKNIILAYPKNKAFRIIYHIIRFEFTRALPSNVQEIIERVNKNLDDKKVYEK